MQKLSEIKYHRILAAMATFDQFAISNNTLFTGALMSSWQTKISPLDPWGNVKMPKIERYERKSKPDIEDWYNTGMEGNDIAVYSSLVTFPLMAMRRM
jgi:hypothetical protein